ncbi:ribosomal-protein-alanine N-acetyltransferase [Paenibacillus endophyticus]|uniref:Ribosomal-protein-alanine N-acetyltransferase n=1 Tax=Paenibacillus endophyticus TaxID=1294268 RepID=A0A7W5C8M7_9BACL|nr:GNAT family protein [Paenibacillus endophyticus]MBB3153148.1 ribosomal-protein-alanine N-acetyltransferase [Paenibacillus endophyticus]
MNNNRVYIRLMADKDSEQLHAIRQRNYYFFKPFEPIRPDEYFTLEEQRRIIQAGIKGAEEDRNYVFGVFEKQSESLMGRIELSGVVRGPFQNASLGFFMDEVHNGKGYMTEAIGLVLEYAFSEVGLHRIQAGVMPRNLASVRVLEKAGFRYEGLAKRYLKINGEWEDHALYAITTEDV